MPVGYSYWGLVSRKMVSPAGYRLDLDGTDDYGSGSQASIPTGSGPVTIAFWARPTGTINDRQYTAVGYGAAGTNAAIHVCIFSGNWVVTNNVDSVGSSAATADAWHHVMAVFDGTTWTMYLDNSAAGSSSMTTAVTGSTSFAIGAVSYSGLLGFRGSLKDVRIYPRALDSTDRAAVYNGGTPLCSAGSPTGLLRWFKVNDNDSILHDLSGSVEDMTLSGSPSWSVDAGACSS